MLLCGGLTIINVMKNIGLLSKDVITRARIQETVEAKGAQLTVIHSSSFDANAFDLLIVDLDDPAAIVVLKQHGYRCMAFAAAQDSDKIEMAKRAGCDRVYKHGEFFKKILPNYKF